MSSAPESPPASPDVAAGVPVGPRTAAGPGGSAIHELAKNGSDKEFEALLDTGGKDNWPLDTTVLNSVDDSGATALSIAAAEGRKAHVKALILRKADLNIQDKMGRTALVRAIAMNREEIVQALLHAGCVIDVPQKNGKTALDEAKASINPRMVTLLEEATPSACCVAM